VLFAAWNSTTAGLELLSSGLHRARPSLLMAKANYQGKRSTRREIPGRTAPNADRGFRAGQHPPNGLRPDNRLDWQESKQTERSIAKLHLPHSLDDRTRDQNPPKAGQIREKRADTQVRKEYGDNFAKGYPSDTHLGTVRDETGKSLSTARLSAFRTGFRCRATLERGLHSARVPITELLVSD
jgi:hypothetical protein